MFKEKFNAWRKEINEHKYLILLSLFFLACAAVLQYFAGSYVTRIETVPVPDLILSHLKPVDLGIIFVYGFMLVVITLFAYPLFFKAKDLHIVISQFSLLVMLREFFVCLTHLQSPAGAIYGHFPSFISLISFQNDLFFSGHVSVTFLGYLLFRKEKIGIFFLIASVIMAITVLLMHLHYSIDVFAAFFITYGSYKIGEWLFRKVDQKG
ncbi:MAG: phosphatase PAP2-related protein [Nanoarchaeota archaeon]|nr:phosphatase PAP2-related protein [Nanoarchaeota archaeon]